MTLWDENAESAYAEGKEAFQSDGVWVLMVHHDGHDPKIEVFEHEADAEIEALKAALIMWREFWEKDFPKRPDTWQEIYDAIRDNAGYCADVISLEHKEIK